MPKTPTDETPEERTPSRREEQFAAIDQARRDFLKDEGIEVAPPEADASTAVIEPEPAAPAAADSPAADPAAAAAEPTLAAAPDQPQLYDVMVDGKPAQVTLEELTRNYQIEAAARSRLGIATGILRRAKTIAADESGGEGAGTAADGSPAPVKPAATKEPPPEPDYEALTKSIQFDDPKESAAKLKEFIDQSNARAAALAGQNSQPAPDSGAIAQQVMNQIELDNTFKTLAKEHTDILVVPEFSGIVSQVAGQRLLADLKRIQEEGTGSRRPLLAYFEEAVDHVRKITGKTKAATPNEGQDSGSTETRTPNGNGKPQQAAPTVDLDPSRVTLKRALPSQPTPRRAASPGAAQPQQVEFTENADLARRQSAIQDMVTARRPRARAT